MGPKVQCEGDWAGDGPATCVWAVVNFFFLFLFCEKGCCKLVMQIWTQAQSSTTDKLHLAIVWPPCFTILLCLHVVYINTCSSPCSNDEDIYSKYLEYFCITMNAANLDFELLWSIFAKVT